MQKVISRIYTSTEKTSVKKSLSTTNIGAQWEQKQIVALATKDYDTEPIQSEFNGKSFFDSGESVKQRVERQKRVVLEDAESPSTQWARVTHMRQQSARNVLPEGLADARPDRCLHLCEQHALGVVEE